MLSVIIASYRDEGYLENCIASLKNAMKLCNEKVEIIVIFNNPSVGQLKACNYGATEAKGECLVFLDADCIVSGNFLKEISEKSKNEHYVGGGVKYVRLSRYSLGILCSMIPLFLYILFKRITAGAFWVKKEVFKEMGGFKEGRKYWDLAFAIALKKYAENKNKKFESLKQSYIIWSTRKYDWSGDWHWLRGYNADHRGYA